MRVLRQGQYLTPGEVSRTHRRLGVILQLRPAKDEDKAHVLEGEVDDLELIWSMRCRRIGGPGIKGLLIEREDGREDGLTELCYLVCSGGHALQPDGRTLWFSNLPRGSRFALRAFIVCLQVERARRAMMGCEPKWTVRSWSSVSGRTAHSAS